MLAFGKLAGPSHVEHANNFEKASWASGDVGPPPTSIPPRNDAPLPTRLAWGRIIRQSGSAEPADATRLAATRGAEYRVESTWPSRGNSKETSGYSFQSKSKYRKQVAATSFSDICALVDCDQTNVRADANAICRYSRIGCRRAFERAPEPRNKTFFESNVRSGALCDSQSLQRFNGKRSPPRPSNGSGRGGAVAQRALSGGGRLNWRQETPPSMTQRGAPEDTSWPASARNWVPPIRPKSSEKRRGDAFPPCVRFC